MLGLRFLQCQCMRAASADKSLVAERLVFSVVKVSSWDYHSFNKWENKNSPVFEACLLSVCKSTLQAVKVLLSECRKAYQEPVLHLKHIWGDIQSCFFFLLIFHIHLLVSVGHRNVTYSQLHRNTGAAWCRYCLQGEIPVRFSICRGLILAASKTEF